MMEEKKTTTAASALGMVGLFAAFAQIYKNTRCLPFGSST
jgi:hypothetical protein